MGAARWYCLGCRWVLGCDDEGSCTTPTKPLSEPACLVDDTICRTVELGVMITGAAIAEDLTWIDCRPGDADPGCPGCGRPGRLRDHVVRVLTIQRALLVAIWNIANTNTAYRDTGCDYFTRLNPRKAAATPSANSKPWATTSPWKKRPDRATHRTEAPHVNLLVRPYAAHPLPLRPFTRPPRNGRCLAEPRPATFVRRVRFDFDPTLER